MAAKWEKNLGQPKNDMMQNNNFTDKIIKNMLAHTARARVYIHNDPYTNTKYT